MKFNIFSILALLINLTLFNAYAQEIPQIISYQGKLLENGLPVSGTKSMTFTIGTWSETHSSVELVDGLYSVQLGSINSIPTSLFDNSPSLELQVSVEGQILSPNSQIQSVAYAFKSEKAVNADMIDGLHSTSFITNPYPGDLTANYFITTTGGFAAESNNISEGFFANDISDGTGFMATNCNTGVHLNECHTGINVTNGTGYGIKSGGNIWDGVYSNNNDENGFNANNNTQWGFYAQGNNSGGFGGQSKGRNMNIVSETSNEAIASFHNNSEKSRGIFVEGDVLSTGGYSLCLKNSDNTEIIAYPIISATKEIIISGTGVLENGHATIKIEDRYESILDDHYGIVVSLTPLDDVNGFLVVNNKTINSFNVHLNEIPGIKGNKNAKFDWLVIGQLQNTKSREETLLYIENERQAKIKMIETQKINAEKDLKR